MTDQKTLLLTGASRGIGHATVKRFEREGWRVLTCSRQPFDPRCPWPNGEANHIQIDLASPDKTIAAIETIKAKINGRLDALVNNAGISPKGPGGARLNTLETDLRTWGQVFHVNFFASIVLARGFKDELAAAKGSVVNVTSIAGVRVHPFAGAAYATSKAALAALTSGANVAAVPVVPQTPAENRIATTPQRYPRSISESLQHVGNHRARGDHPRTIAFQPCPRHRAFQQKSDMGR